MTQELETVTPSDSPETRTRRLPLGRVLTLITVGLLLVFISLTVFVPAFLVEQDTTVIIIAACFVLFFLTLTSCYHLLGGSSTSKCLLVALTFGWFAEHMGVTRGWFFGGYTYTDVMGPKLGGVPLVVPPMWFSLCYIGSIISNLIVHKSPLDPSSRGLERVTISLLGAFIVTAYDLAADPYMIRVMHAWIMTEKHGDYFGETVQGFAGWVIVAFAIMFTVRSMVLKVPKVKPIAATRIDALIPVGTYFALLLTFVVAGHPVEVRSTVVFAMGIPIIAALAGFAQWNMTGDPARIQPN